jgi:hypothetical protein
MSTMNDDLLARLLEKVEHRFYGKYRSFVSDNNDPEKRGRLKLRIPSVLGKDVISGWALPCAPYGGAAGQGIFFIPDKDAGVWVEFEAGLLEYPVWVGTFWCKPGNTTEVPPPADKQGPPTSKIIKTKNHTIEFADESGKEAIRITDAANSGKITLDKDGIKLEAGATAVSIAKDGAIGLDAGSNDITVKAANVKVTVSGSMEVS